MSSQHGPSLGGNVRIQHLGHDRRHQLDDPVRGPASQIVSVFTTLAENTLLPSLIQSNHWPSDHSARRKRRHAVRRCVPSRLVPAVELTCHVQPSSVGPSSRKIQSTAGATFTISLSHSLPSRPSDSSLATIRRRCHHSTSVQLASCSTTSTLLELDSLRRDSPLYSSD